MVCPTADARPVAAQWSDSEPGGLSVDRVLRQATADSHYKPLEPPTHNEQKSHISVVRVG